MPFDLNIRGIGPASVYWSDAASVKKRCTAEFNIKVSLTVKNMILQIRKLFEYVNKLISIIYRW